MTVLDNAETVVFSTPSKRVKLTYARDNPQPPDGKWLCA